MISIEVLEKHFDEYCENIRTNPKIRAWFTGIGPTDTFFSHNLENGDMFICEIELGKRLTLSYFVGFKLPSEVSHECFNRERESASTLTRNLPHDIQRLIKGTTWIVYQKRKFTKEWSRK